MERIRRRLEAQKLEANRTGELQNLQEQQKLESQKMQARTLRRSETGSGSGSTTGVATTSNPMQDLQDLDFGAASARLPPPLRPDSDEGAYSGGWATLYPETEANRTDPSRTSAITTAAMRSTAAPTAASLPAVTRATTVPLTLTPPRSAGILIHRPTLRSRRRAASRAYCPPKILSATLSRTTTLRVPQRTKSRGWSVSVVALLKSSALTEQGQRSNEP